MLGEEERIAFREFHHDLVTAVRVHEPLKRDLSAQHLVLQWVSEASGQRRHVVVAFNVRRPPWDMVLLQLEVPSTHCQYELPMVLKPKREQGQFCKSLLRSDVEFCHELAKDANDWVLFRLKLADLTCDFAEFKVVDQEELTRASLRQAAEEMRQALRAAKAAKLAQGLTAPKKRKKRSVGKQRNNKQARRPLASHGQRPRCPCHGRKWSKTIQNIPRQHLRLLLCLLGLLEVLVGPSKLEQFRGALSNWRRSFQPAVKLVGARSAANIAIEATNCLAKRL